MDIPKHVAVIMDGNGRGLKKEISPDLQGIKKESILSKKLLKRL